MNIIPCLIKAPAEPIKLGVLDTYNIDFLMKITGARNKEELCIHVFDERLGVIFDQHAAQKQRAYSCSVDGVHFYGTVIFTGIKKYRDQMEVCDIVLTPGLIEEYLPAEDRYEGGEN